MLVVKIGISLRLKSRRNPNNFLECRSLSLSQTTFAPDK